MLVLQHIGCEPPAAYEDELVDRGFALDRVRLDEGEALPDWRAYGGIVAMGGPMGAYDDELHPWLGPEKQLIADAVRAGKPYWGVCLGAQLLAASLGASVTPGESPEVGVFPVERTDRAAAGPGVLRRAGERSRRFTGTAIPTRFRTAPCSWLALSSTSSRRSFTNMRTRCSFTSR